MGEILAGMPSNNSTRARKITNESYSAMRHLPDGPETEIHRDTALQCQAAVFVSRHFPNNIVRWRLA